MFQSLKIRLALSHTLPLLVIFPLLGLSLLYLLETRYFLSNLADELVAEGELMAAFTRDDPEIWQDPASAREVLDNLLPVTAARLMLIDSDGIILASSLRDDLGRIGTIVDSDPTTVALRGQTDWHINFSAGLGERVVDVAVPVFDRQGVQVGVFRLSHSLGEVDDLVGSLRWLVLGTLIATSFLGVLIGLFLARSIGTPIVKLDQAVRQIHPGAPAPEIQQTGPQELRRLAHAFNEMTRRIQQLEDDRRQLIAGIVHELGRPLGAIKAGVQALVDGAYAESDLKDEFAAEIESQFVQLRRTIDDLTLLGETSLPGLSLHLETVNLCEVVQVQCRMYASSARQKNIDLVCEIEDHCPPLLADADRLGQIVGNLLNNSIKYSRPGDRVTVSIDSEGQGGKTDELLVHVRDTGPGIEPEEQGRIFHLYYRNPKLQRIHQGMGIGLAVSRRMAEAHGGSLTVESEPGKGSTFTLRLPVRPVPDTKHHA